jgi:hypothetical protein
MFKRKKTVIQERITKTVLIEDGLEHMEMVVQREVTLRKPALPKHPPVLYNSDGSKYRR